MAPGLREIVELNVFGAGWRHVCLVLVARRMGRGRQRVHARLVTRYGALVREWRNPSSRTLGP